jgi:hypothetical protein
MNLRDSNLLWLGDLLEHLAACRQQLELTDDPRSVRLLTEAMLRDLDSCRKVCETLREQRRPQLVG